MIRALLLLGLVSCRSKPDLPSVLLVTVSGLRADRLGVSGHSAAKTPNLDALAVGGTRFSRAYTTAPESAPAHATIFTGLIPPLHGVHGDGTDVLSESVPTLAAALSDRGVHTLAFTASPVLHPQTGLTRGFSRVSADRTPEGLSSSLSAVPGAVFAWVHLDPLAEPKGRGMERSDAYDAAVNALDGAVGGLVQAWRQQRPGARVIVTADHGLALGDHGEHGHGWALNDSTVRVPLIINGEGISADWEVAEVVSLTDVAPTIAAWMGIPWTANGRDLILGGTDQAYSEAMRSHRALGSVPLRAITRQDGRYTEGIWGGWYPVIGTTVRHFPDPESNHPELAALLAERWNEAVPLVSDRAGLSSDVVAEIEAVDGLVWPNPGVPGSGDPREQVQLLSLIQRVEAALAQNRTGVLKRLRDRIAEAAPDAPLIERIDREISRRAAAPPRP